ncbi:two-partner secretion domain-containing protein [Rhodocyclus tenuis]|uniref:Filamentous hemagglutinin family protein n=1 Tax=Rhodocyclus tenuis TaxID=1066 RepID=A0A840GJI2_RHOTE|nr:filamentous haemagglutinin family protein [Rhodocyclus tenuis]MBB4248329.1 filamentous hemagglutinin family protein [Rhodocyclus tenuis]
MNKGIFRLVFDARRGMHVPAAECVRGCGKRTSRQRSPRSAGAAVASALALLAGNAEAARPLPSSANLTPQFNLPQAAANFNQLGRATQAIDAANAQRMIVNQTDQRVILNWSSFDIGAGYTVKFVQPTGGSALNNIRSSDPSVILGNIEANAEVILYNANGMLFGKGATVTTGNFIATTLKIADEQFEKGYRNITSYTPAFQAADGETGGFIRVEAGASINAASGGDILMFAPRVLNEGRLSAPGGQVALAAGQKVYLAASLDPAARGLLVEVDPFATADKDYNTVENAATGSTKVTLDSGELVQRVNEIVTERGSISLVGLSVKQNGTARATTAVKGQNGAIYLLAHGKTVLATHSDGIEGHTMAKAVEAGELVLGATSVTRVDPDASNATQLDAEYFYNSIVRLEGKQIHLLGGAQIIAPGAGSVTPAATATNQETKRGVSIVASATPLSSGVFGTATSASDDSWIVIDPKVLIDVSGTNVNLPMSRNVLTGRLFAIQLADSPLQRTGVLYRTEVSFDRRKNNNTGLKVANVSDFYGQIARTAAEKLSAGGTISIKSDGAVVVGQRARLDVSGGTLNYAGGEIRTTLLRQGNRLIDIADARADVIYDEVITPSQGRYEAGYVEGKDAGTLTVAGRRLVLDGELAGKVVAGPYQRGASAGSRPLAGRLQVGIVAGPSGTPDYYVNNLVLSQTRATALAESFFASPFATGLGARGETATISADALQAGGFGRVELLANELFSLQTGTRLNLGAGGSFSATAGHIDIDGSISAPAGSITLTASPTILTGATPAAGVASVVFSEGASLSTAGYWSNDGRNAGGNVDSALANDGGSITVAAYDSIVLPTGAALDVSAGAWRNASGKLSFGKAGSIELAANAGNSDPLLQVGKVTLDGSVSGFGFSGGGTFKLTTLDLSVSDAAATAGLNVKPGFFSANGFENITLNSNRDLTIAEKTTVNAQLRNRALNSNAAAQQSGSAIAAVSHLASSAEVDAVARKAVNIAFAATRQPSVVTGTDGANLVVGKGATIATEAGGSLSFSAGNNLTVAGTLSAPGGSIALTVEGTRGGGSVDNADKIGFDPTQALWLTDSAKIQAGGVVEYANSRNGMKTGQVYGGGTVKLNAKHGYLIAEEGSEIDIRGYETTLDVYKGSASTLVSRAAGTLFLSSPEGILVDSTINAAAPESGRAAGGTLEVSISRQGLDNFTQGDAYSTAERRIVVRKDGKSLPADIKPGDDLNSAVGNGVAAISAKTINAFSAAKLRADDRIEFAHDVDLATTRSLELDTRVIAAQGNAAVTLAAPYVALGNIDIAPITGMSTPTAGSGAASFTVTANLVDVVGTLGLQGFATSSLNATRSGRQDGEIRLRGRAFSGTTAQTGALLFAGQLKLTAGQIYPTTFSDYAITGLPGNSTISTFAPQGGSTAALPLSAFGKLKLSANNIEHGGVIRAPFGQLELNATNKLTLDADSELSVAGSGLTVPVGNTVNGTTWYYRPLGTGSSELVNITALPLAKQILLSAGTLDASAQARVSAAGGGDVQASEFVVGAGGSTDYLASTKGLYAVLPNYKFDYAPYDAQIYANSDLKPGEQIVVTMAGSKLAPGTYTLLPAIYALLSPDAVLVSRAADQGSSALPAAISQTDGSAVVTAYRSVAGTTLAGDDYQRYVIEPAATFRAKSSYTLTSGSDFFAAKAAREGSAAGSLPRDAGRISLSAAHMTNWQALFDLAAPAGARGGEFDLAVPDIVVVKNGQSASENHTAADGYTVVSTESLAATGAASILLGGTRSDSNGTTSIATSSDKVRVESDMNGNELLFAAKTEVAVADNVTISTSGSSETVTNQLKLSGDGAFLRVSTRKGVDVVRSGAARAPGVGTLTIGRNVKLAGAQVDVDATGKMSLDSSATLVADAFGLGAGRISFGGASPEGDSVSIDGKLLETLGAASSLSLRSYSTIDFLDSLDLILPGKGKLVLDAAGLRGSGGTDSKVNLGAAEVLLRNSTGQTVAATGQGTLSIAAKPPLRDSKTGGMEIGPGNQSLGFDSATLSSTGDMVFSGTGKLSSQSDLTLAAQRVTATSAADQAVAAGGVLTINRPDDGRTLGERVGLGAKLSLSGERVVQNGTIDLAGGQLTINAANTATARYGVEFGSGSVTRAGGFSVAADEWTTYGDAGSIKVTAAKGDIKVDGIVGVAALAGGGNAGSLSLSASDGTLDLASDAVLEGAGGAKGEGGSFSADLGKIADAENGSIDRIAAATSNFSRKFELRVRKGDVALKSQQVRAKKVSIAADAGSLSVSSTIDARAAAGGVVQLAAGRDMTLAKGGKILAASSRAGANGGDVLLASTAGTVSVMEDSTIDVGGDDILDGRVVLRAERAGSTVKVAKIGGAITAGEIDIDAVQTYSGTSLTTGKTNGAVLGQDSIITDNTTFMQNKGTILDALGVTDDSRFHLRPGVEIRSTGDFTVSKDWNLYSASRLGGEAGFLTIRAAGKLNINGTISDGFDGVARNSTLMSGDAWSMRLVAGADLGDASLGTPVAANPLAINTAGSGDLSIAGGKLLRTTSGSIDLAAGHDIILGGTTAAPATVMVTGTLSELDPDLAAAYTKPADAVFTKNGAHISATAGNDIKSPASDQLLIDNWFSRSGRLDTDTGMYYDNVAWWSRFDLFRHGFGSFGGGNIVLSAGGNMQNVSAVAPSSARMASTTPDMSRLIVENGGDIEVTAGGNIAGGAYFVGRGEGKLSAGGSITKGSSPASNVGQLAPVLAMMDGSWTLRAQSDIGITTAFNPTIFNARKGTSFYTYGDAARLDVASTAGSISWPSVAQNVFSSLAKLATASAEKMTLIDTDYLTLNVLPPNVRLTAFEGGINLSANSTNALGVSLFPSATGNLELYSGGDTLINTSVRIMDNDPASLPGIVNFTEGTAATLFVGMPGGITSYDINKLVLTDLHAGDNDPVRIHADGSITVTDGRLILSPKQTRISAGMDIINLSLYGQHHRASDVTQISAGRNILSTTIVPTRGLISLAGPGTLEMTAGRQLSLGASAGVETTGNIYNPSLSAEGASIRMAAGLAATLDADGFSSFVTNYLGASGAPSGSSYRQALVDYVKKTLNQGASATYTDDEALAVFSGFSSAGRIAFVKTVLAEEFGRTYLAAGKPYATAWAQAAAKAGVTSDVYGGETFEWMRNEVLFAELKLGGIAGSSAKGATAKEAGYAQGYKAIDLAGYGSPFDFVGNIDLIQSKVQTKSGGDIEFIAPGGGVNVGLSADVSNAVGGKKTSDKRGVVAYANGNIRSFSDGNFLVNAQKVFVIGAGDILLWSSNGDIDSGKGSNNTVTVPPLVPKIDPKDGSISFELPSLATGSGIGILDASDGKADGAAYLFAPRGEVVALDAFIRAPVVYFDPDKIRGADNVIGTAVNPVSTPPSVSVGGLGSVTANPADNLATASVAPKSGEKEKNSILTVEVLAMGDGASGSTGSKANEESADESDEKKAKRRKCRANEPESDCVTKL